MKKPTDYSVGFLLYLMNLRSISFSQIHSQPDGQRAHRLPVESSFVSSTVMVVSGAFDSVGELFDASGMPMSSFGSFFGVPPRTMQDWIYGASPCPQYVIDLMAYKLEHENKI